MLMYPSIQFDHRRIFVKGAPVREVGNEAILMWKYHDTLSWCSFAGDNKAPDEQQARCDIWAPLWQTG